MKLTDKDLLVDAVQGAINIIEDNGINMLSASVPLAIIKGAPTIEAIPVRHGHWIYKRGGWAECSECHHDYKDVYDLENSDNYCRYCGALMDGNGEAR